MDALMSFQQPDTGDIQNPETGALLAVSWILVVIAFVHFCLRTWSRRLIEKRFTADDWFLVFAMLSTIALPSTITVAAHSGRWAGTPTAETLKAVTAFNFIYWFATLGLKTSVLLFFYRFLTGLNTERRYAKSRTAILIALGAVTIHSLVSAFLIIFACHPVSLLWTPHVGMASCIDINNVQGINSTINCFTSSLIVSVPTIFFYENKLQCRYRGLFNAVVAIGSVSVLASLARVLTFFVFENTVQHKSLVLFLPLFSILELALGITAASLQCIDALIRRNEINEAPIPTPSRLRIQQALAARPGSKGSRFSRSSKTSLGRTKPVELLSPKTIDTASSMESGLGIRMARAVTIQAKVEGSYGPPHGVLYDKYGQRIDSDAERSRSHITSQISDMTSIHSSVASSIQLPLQSTWSTSTESPAPPSKMRLESPARASTASSGVLSKPLPPIQFLHNRSSSNTSAALSMETIEEESRSSSPEGLLSREKTSAVDNRERHLRRTASLTNEESDTIPARGLRHSRSTTVKSNESLNKRFAREIDIALDSGLEERESSDIPRLSTDRSKSPVEMAGEYMLKANYGSQEGLRQQYLAQALR